MSVYGLFNDEGMVEGDFYSVEEARAAIADRYSPDDGLDVLECCPGHPDQPRVDCQECEAEDRAAEGEEDEDEEDD